MLDTGDGVSHTVPSMNAIGCRTRSDASIVGTAFAHTILIVVAANDAVLTVSDGADSADFVRHTQAFKIKQTQSTPAI